MSKELNHQFNILIADFTVCYQKLRHYHWNVRGPQFFKLHEKFEEIYTEVGDVIDQLAERMIGLDGIPLHTLEDMLEEATLQEDPAMPEPGVMVARTIEDIQTINKSLNAVIKKAEKEGDRTTANLLDDVKDGLEAHLWMLKAWEAK